MYTSETIKGTITNFKLHLCIVVKNLFLNSFYFLKGNLKYIKKICEIGIFPQIKVYISNDFEQKPNAEQTVIRRQRSNLIPRKPM